MESTADLLALVRNGDAAARERLVGRYLPLLRRWASGRLPGAARDLTDTDDLVQVTLIRALSRIGSFEPRREGAFLAYLRTALKNAILDEIRRSARRGTRIPLDESTLPDSEQETGDATAREGIQAYERALDELPELQREAVILRLELGFSYAEIAAAVESASPDAARMMVKRGLARIADAMPDWAA